MAGNEDRVDPFNYGGAPMPMQADDTILSHMMRSLSAKQMTPEMMQRLQSQAVDIHAGVPTDMDALANVAMPPEKPPVPAHALANNPPRPAQAASVQPKQQAAPQPAPAQHTPTTPTPNVPEDLVPVSVVGNAGTDNAGSGNTVTQAQATPQATPHPVPQTVEQFMDMLMNEYIPQSPPAMSAGNVGQQQTAAPADEYVSAGQGTIAGTQQEVPQVHSRGPNGEPIYQNHKGEYWIKTNSGDNLMIGGEGDLMLFLNDNGLQ